MSLWSTLIHEVDLFFSSKAISFLKPNVFDIFRGSVLFPQTRGKERTLFTIPRPDSRDHNLLCLDSTKSPSSNKARLESSDFSVLNSETSGCLCSKLIG